MQSVDNTIREANKFLKNKEFVKAEVLYKSILKKYPKNLRAINGLKETKVSSSQNLPQDSQNLNTKLEMIYKHYDKGEYLLTIEKQKNYRFLS